MQARTAITTLGALLLLSACSGPSGNDPETSTPATNEPAATTGSGTEAAPDGMAAAPAAADSGGTEAAAGAGFPFTVEVTLADAAARRMKRDGETVVVRTAYFGAATPEAEAGGETNDVGMVDLGWASTELAAGEHKAEFDGSRFKRDRLKFISGSPQINISVYSGRHASEDNILDCDPYEDSLAAAAKSPIRLGCRLLPDE